MYKPLVAVVGRPNVGKSTLFNAIVKKRISIVEDIPGVTRDRIYFDAEWLGQEFTMIDTGGIEFVDSDNHIFTSMRYQAELAIREADVILYVVDGKVGVQPQDEEIAHILRSCGKPVILVVNKIDSVEQEMNIYEFYSLGLGDPIGVSAVNLMNLGDLLDEVLKYIKKVPAIDDDDEAIHIALVGRPNVGKSSLTNALLGQDRVIVSNVPGRRAIPSTPTGPMKGRISSSSIRPACAAKPRSTCLSNAIVLSGPCAPSTGRTSPSWSSMLQKA